VLGRYELLERIAIGGMAEGFRGRVVGAAGFEKHVAIKRILPTFSRDERFIKALVNEAKIASSMSQANIVQMHDVGVAEDGQYFLVMEFVDGRDLRTVLEKLARDGRRISQDLAMFVIAEITEALEYVHRRTDGAGNLLRLIHRDVSPPNILISRNGEVKLADFGIAKRSHEQSVVSTLKGKFSYMSPEQSRLALLDHTTDLFSLGAVLYELLTGRRAFSGASDLETLLLVREARYIPPSEIDPRISIALEAIIARALAHRQRDRYQSAAELGSALREVRFSQTEAGGGAVELSRLMNELFPADVPRTVDPPRRDVITLSTMVRHDSFAPTIAMPVTPEPAPGPAIGPMPQPPPRSRAAHGAVVQSLLGGAVPAAADFAEGATGDSVLVEIDHLLGMPKHRATPPPMPIRAAQAAPPPPAHSPAHPPVLPPLMSAPTKAAPPTPPPAASAPPPPRERRETPTAKFELIAKDLRARRESSVGTVEPIPLTRRKAPATGLRTVLIATVFGGLGASAALGAFVVFGGVRVGPSAVDGGPRALGPPPADAAPADAAVVVAPRPDAGPQLSWVTLRSDPTGAYVEVDDVALCTTSCGRELKPGRRRFRFSLAGHQPWSEIVELASGEHREINVRLSTVEPPPPKPQPRPKPKPQPKPKPKR
jgi:serine/threonine protein kinase